VVGLSRSVNSAERALRAVEAEAASRRIVSGQRDALVHQLDDLVSLQTAGAAGTEKEVLRTARAEVEAAFEKDAKLQQASIEGAIRALRDGATTAADDLVAPLFSKTLDAAAKSAAAKPASKPFSSPQTVDIFRKRFGLSEWGRRAVGFSVGLGVCLLWSRGLPLPALSAVLCCALPMPCRRKSSLTPALSSSTASSPAAEDAVTADALKAATKDAAARAVLVGKVGGAEPAVGTPFVLKPAIAYAK